MIVLFKMKNLPIEKDTVLKRIGGIFAQEKLLSMAKYRNRLVHFYAEISPTELYEILQKDLGDFDVFLTAIKNVLENPNKYKISVG